MYNAQYPDFGNSGRRQNPVSNRVHKPRKEEEEAANGFLLREPGRRIRCKRTISPEKQISEMARAAPMLVSQLQRASHCCLGEKLPASGSCGRSREEREHPRRRTRESDITVWKDRQRHFHNGLSLPDLCIPSFCHLFKQLRHEASLRMNQPYHINYILLFAVCVVLKCTYFSLLEQSNNQIFFIQLLISS